MQIFRPEDLRRDKRPSIQDIPDLTPKPIMKTTDINWVVEKIRELEARIERIERELRLR
ncbi:MAG: hypothetical protein QXJ68_05290 [Methanocellales archaeon]